MIFFLKDNVENNVYLTEHRFVTFKIAQNSECDLSGVFRRKLPKSANFRTLQFCKVGLCSIFS